MFIQPSYTMLLKVAGMGEHEVAQDAHVHTCTFSMCSHMFVHVFTLSMCSLMCTYMYLEQECAQDTHHTHVHVCTYQHSNRTKFCASNFRLHSYH